MSDPCLWLNGLHQSEVGGGKGSIRGMRSLAQLADNLHAYNIQWRR